MLQRSARVLVVDDDAAMTSLMEDELPGHGYEVVTATRADDALALAADASFDVVVTDLRMPGADGLTVLAAAKRAVPERPVVVMTAFGAIDSAVESLRRGAYHYLLKPFKIPELDLFVKRALAESSQRKEHATLKRAFDGGYASGALIAESAAMRDVRELALRVADSTVPVLLTGETGTGKGLVARVIHNEGPRASGPFVPINCAALPDNLLESELFGHVRGAFTGATANRDGLFVEADGGTLFLDEIGDMQPALQAKLLHVLESGRVRAVGASREREVDVRLITATHRDLRALTAEARFRSDLLYRIEGVTIELPPLRLHRDDIAPLVARFIETARARTPRSPVTAMSREAMASLLGWSWPGNVRELQHAVERAVLLGQSSEATPADLPPAVRDAKPASNALSFGDTIIPVRELTRAYAAWAVEQLGGRKGAACEKLGIDAKTLNKWLTPDGD